MWPRLAVLVLLPMLAALNAAAPASAHAALIGSTPAEGATLAQSPARFELRFNEPVRVLVLGLVGPHGAPVPLAGVAAADGMVSAAPVTGLDQGTHVLSYRIASADGHPVAGTLVFSIGQADTASSTNAELRGLATRALLWSARLALMLGLTVGAGGAFFAAMFGMGQPRVVMAAACLGLAALPAVIGLHGLDALGQPLGRLTEGAPWITGLTTGLGATAALAAPALLAILATSRTVRFGLVSLPLAAAAFAVSGHAATAAPIVLMRSTLFVHTACMVVWIGALLPLRHRLGRDPGGVAQILPRFSAAILPVFLLLLASGAVLAVVQLGSIGAILDTAYGGVLAMKLMLVAAICLLAAWNRRALTPALLYDPPAGAAWLRRSIAAEALLAILILAVAGLWRFTPPPRTLVPPRPAPLAMHIHGERVMADITVTPGRAGPNDLAIVLQTGSFTPFVAQEVNVSFAAKAAGIAAIIRKARRGDDGVWRADALPLVIPGLWQVTLDVLVNDFEQVTLEDTMELSS
jgi:copper transport protein